MFPKRANPKPNRQFNEIRSIHRQGISCHPESRRNGAL